MNEMDKINHYLRKRRKSYLRKNKWVHKFTQTKEFVVIGFFAFILCIISLRLFYLQVVKQAHYEQEISQIHYKESTLQAERGHIYAMDKTGRPLKLTENITVYDLFVEPHHLENQYNKDLFIDAIAPHIYKHLCVKQIAVTFDENSCVENLEVFTNKKLLPEKPEFFYMGSGILSP
jgi:cell division protein FtsI/penicillin-binding protein 2